MPQLATVKKIRIFCFLEGLSVTKILYVTISYTCPCFINWFIEYQNIFYCFITHGFIRPSNINQWLLINALCFGSNYWTEIWLREAAVTRSDIQLTSKTKLSFHKILLSRVRYISSTKKLKIACAGIKIECSYLKCKTRNKFRDFLKQVEIEERGKDAPLFPCFSCCE